MNSARASKSQGSFVWMLWPALLFVPIALALLYIFAPSVKLDSLNLILPIILFPFFSTFLVVGGSVALLAYRFLGEEVNRKLGIFLGVFAVFWNSMLFSILFLDTTTLYKMMNLYKVSFLSYYITISFGMVWLLGAWVGYHIAVENDLRAFNEQFPASVTRETCATFFQEGENWTKPFDTTRAIIYKPLFVFVSLYIGFLAITGVGASVTKGKEYQWVFLLPAIYFALFWLFKWFTKKLRFAEQSNGFVQLNPGKKAILFHGSFMGESCIAFEEVLFVSYQHWTTTGSNSRTNHYSGSLVLCDGAIHELVSLSDSAGEGVIDLCKIFADAIGVVVGEGGEIIYQPDSLRESKDRGAPTTWSKNEALSFDGNSPFSVQEENNKLHVSYQPIITDAGKFYIKLLPWQNALKLSGTLALGVLFFKSPIFTAILHSPDLPTAKWLKEWKGMEHYLILGALGVALLVGLVRLYRENSAALRHFFERRQLTLEDDKLTFVVFSGGKTLKRVLPKDDFLQSRVTFQMELEATLEVETEETTRTLFELYSGFKKGKVEELLRIDRAVKKRYLTSESNSSDSTG